MKKINIEVKRLDDRAVIPSQAHSDDAGWDLVALTDGTLPAWGQLIVHTGLSFAVPKGYEMQVRPRSGLMFKKGVYAGFGTVDSPYRGEVCVCLYNHTDNNYPIAAGDRVAQFVINEIPSVKLNEVKQFTEEETDRGTGGFGSTGR